MHGTKENPCPWNQGDARKICCLTFNQNVEIWPIRIRFPQGSWCVLLARKKELSGNFSRQKKNARLSIFVKRQFGIDQLHRFLSFPPCGPIKTVDKSKRSEVRTPEKIERSAACVTQCKRIVNIIDPTGCVPSPFPTRTPTIELSPLRNVPFSQNTGNKLRR